MNTRCSKSCVRPDKHRHSSVTVHVQHATCISS